MSHDQRHDADIVKRHLLAMLATKPIDPPADPPALSPQQWSHLSRMAKEHRLGPLLHATLQGTQHLEVIPPYVQEAWSTAFRRSAMRALLAQSTLLKIAKTLGQANITYAALKGASLVWHVYSHPALRPMRDLDILVMPDRVMEAYQALIAVGFERSASDLTPVTFALEHKKDLPGLLDPKTGIYVELHMRLFDHQGARSSSCLLSRIDDLLALRIWRDLSSERIAVLPATATLLHLVVHSAHEHHFDNGPQVLTDIDAILRSEIIDWPQFWAMAKDGGWERAAQLLLVLTEKYHGAQPVEWEAGVGEQVPSDVVEVSALMMLQDFSKRADLAIQVMLTSGAPLKRRFRLWQRLFPHRHVIASSARIEDHPAAWLHYPAWLLSRLRRTAVGTFNREQRTEAIRAGRVVAWLGES